MNLTKQLFMKKVIKIFDPSVDIKEKKYLKKRLIVIIGLLVQVEAMFQFLKMNLKNMWVQMNV